MTSARRGMAALSALLVSLPLLADSGGRAVVSERAGLESLSTLSSVQFVDVSLARGFNFVGTYGTPFPLSFTNRVIQLNMGNGAAVGDYDGDGDLDVYLLAQMNLPNQLLRNDLDQGAPGFTDVTATAGVGDLGLSRVAHFADLDNDGDQDLVLVNDNGMNSAYPVSKLYRNEGDGTFADVTAGSGFTPLGYLRCGASLADYDGDGLLDIYVTNWSQSGGSTSAAFPGSNRLYRNLGGFVFEDVTETVGLGVLNVDSFTALFHDFDDDQRPDLWVAVDHGPDVFYWNTPTGFVEDTLAVGVDHVGNDMGAACADFDDDGDLDVYMTNITDPDGFFGTGQLNALHVNQQDVSGTTWFIDEATPRGVDDTYWGWGTEFTDVENDGDLDLVAVNGYDEFIDLISPGSAIYQTPSVLFVNDGAGNFTRNSTAGLEDPDDSRALIAFDYDRDGDEDLLITNVNQPARLLENVSDPQGHWLQVGLTQDVGANRDGIGATVWATVGAVTMRRDILAGESYLAGTPTEVHFGLGEATSIDELRVDWTDGTQSSFFNVQVDRTIEIVQNFPDADLDGVLDASDCDPDDGLVWAAPGAATGLVAAGGASTTFSWSGPGGAGAAASSFDLVRGDDPGFGAPTCVASGVAATSADDDEVPASIAFYIVRARNGCGDHAGADSSGTPRALPACP